MRQRDLFGLVGVEVSQEEYEARLRLLSRLFALYRDTDEQRVLMYVDETLEIPAPFLGLAVRAIVRGRVYPSLPTVGDLWAAAKKAAGMDREQYRSGRYLPPPREWPPAGKRWGITAGELEALPGVGSLVKQLGAGEEKPRQLGSKEAEVFD